MPKRSTPSSSDKTGGLSAPRKNRVIIPAVLLAIVLAAAMAGCGSKKDTAAPAGDGATTTAKAGKTTTTTTPKLYPGRIDSQPKDHEASVDQAVDFSGYTTSVDKAGYQRSLSDYEKDGYIVATVTITNRDAKAQRYGSSDFKLQTPGGQVLDSDFTSNGGELNSADLVQGGTATGTVTFKVGQVKGDYYIIYKPDPFDASRGIWKVTV